MNHTDGALTVRNKLLHLLYIDLVRPEPVVRSRNIQIQTGAPAEKDELAVTIEGN